MRKRELAVAIATSSAVSILTTLLIIASLGPHFLNFGGGANIDFGVNVPRVHVTVTMYRYGVKVFESSHPGAVSNFGLNATLAKLTGYAAFYNMSTYNLNTTYIGIAFMSSGPNATSVILDGEWNRTLATPHDPAYNHINYTAVFYPDAGPYSANCMGGYLEVGGASLVWYDFISPTKTGIDNTFVITVEAEITVASA